MAGVSQLLPLDAAVELAASGDVSAGQKLERLGAQREVTAELVARVRARDRAAVVEFVRSYQQMVFALLARVTGRSADVEDLAQETFLRALRGLEAFDCGGTAKLSTWLLTIATRVAIDARRRAAPATEPLCGDEPTDAPGPEEDRRRREIRGAIDRATAQLPEEQRIAFVLAECHDRSVAEISEITGASEATVKTRLFRAREKLRTALRPFHEES